MLNLVAMQSVPFLTGRLHASKLLRFEKLWNVFQNEELRSQQNDGFYVFVPKVVSLICRFLFAQQRKTLAWQTPENHIRAIGVVTTFEPILDSAEKYVST